MPSTASAVKRTMWRAILDKPLSFPAGSSERRAAIRELASRPIADADTGRIRKLSIRTLERRCAGYDADGMAALGRKRRSDAGRNRVVISRAWDKAVTGASEAGKAEVREELLGYIRAQHKNHEGPGNIAYKAALRLAQFTRERLGIDPPPGTCAIPPGLIAAEYHFRRAAMRRLDAKAFADASPGVTRTRAGMRPMQLVFGDVHHMDILLPEFEGLQRYAKAVSWLDRATNRMWMTLFVLPKGQGIRNEHVIASFIEMCMAWGLPERLYLDNGSEYAWADFVEDAMRLASGGGRRFIVRAMPHNARAKPIEGIFRVLEYNHFAKLPGWVGGNRMKAKTANVGRAPTPFTGDLGTFRLAIDGALALYHAIPQRTALGGLSPVQTFNAAVEAGWTKTEVDPDAFATVFATEELRTVRQGRISVAGRWWTCDALQSYLGDSVVALVPKFNGYARLPIKDERGRLIGIADEDRAFGYLDTAGAAESGRRKRLRLVSARALEATAPTIDPLGETITLAPNLPRELPAPAGARLTASDEQKRIASGLRETPKERRAREDAEAKREHEQRTQLHEKLMANRTKSAP
ncbi:MAG: hypothetical protein KDJ20_00270 [Hyphomicrobiales bacterium]|nr:hypothetical protein [Hyphomicrobiales bacterium]MCC2107448.1 hypothetical protein [Hyphomicrobiales bacterium]